jgi:Tol biopolymer transport system component
MTMLASSRILCGAGCVIVTGLLATSRVADRTGAVLPAASTPHIAFASHRDGNWEIYLTDVDGGHQTRLTRRDPQDRFPLWSPDRSQIAFGSQVGGDHWELWVMNVDGTNPRFLATQIVAKGHRQWSHDGTRIVFAAKVDGDVEIFSVEVASGRLIRLTNSPGEDADPSWSRDDSHIAFSSARDSNAEIYVMGADGTDPRRLTNHAATDGRPAWSPDGSRIAFVSTRDGDRDIYLVRVDDGRLERLTTGAHATNDGVRWSPNGSYIAVQTAERDNYDIQLVRMADHERRTVAGTPGFDLQFSWSPAGDQLAFISERDGFNAVYVTDLMGKQSRLTTTPSLNPEWSP